MNVTTNEVIVLKALKNNNLVTSNLFNSVKLEKNSMVRAINGLADKGFLLKKRALNDKGRPVNLSITPRGLMLLEGIRMSFGYDDYSPNRDWYVIFGIIIFILFIIIIIGFVLLAIFMNDIGSTSGEHTGIITAYEHNNNLFWDADLIYFKSSDQSTQEERYCINQNLIDRAKQASSNKSTVTISFQNDFWFMNWECNGGQSIVWSIK